MYTKYKNSILEVFKMEMQQKEHIGIIQTLKVVFDIFFGHGIEVWDEDYRKEHHIGLHGEQLG